MYCCARGHLHARVTTRAVVYPLSHARSHPGARTVICPPSRACVLPSDPLTPAAITRARLSAHPWNQDLPVKQTWIPLPRTQFVEIVFDTFRKFVRTSFNGKYLCGMAASTDQQFAGPRYLLPPASRNSTQNSGSLHRNLTSCCQPVERSNRTLTLFLPENDICALLCRNTPACRELA